MITTYTYTIPCSCCGDLITVTGKRYCSGACKVKAFRDTEVQTLSHDIETPSTVITEPKKIKKTKTVKTKDIEPCRHGLMYCRECKEE